MKTSLILITTVLLAPATLLAGAGVAAIIGFSTLAGVGAIALSDYAKPVADSSTLSIIAVTRKAEKLPLAA